MNKKLEEQTKVGNIIIKCPNCNNPVTICNSITGCEGWITAGAFFNCRRCGYNEDIHGEVRCQGIEFKQCWRCNGSGCFTCDGIGTLKIERILEIEVEL